VDNGPVRRVWDPGESSRTGQTLALLQIESKVNVRDAYFAKLQDRVLTMVGWLELMSGIDCDQTLAYGVSRLHKWVMKESGWSDEDKALTHSAFRKAVLGFIHDEDRVWTCTVYTLRLLAEAICIDGGALTDSEKSMFSTAAKTVVNTIRNNADQSDEVRDEAEELVSLTRIGGLALRTEIDRLTYYADTLAERESERESGDPESPYLTEASPDEEFDIDALFAGLLDR